MEKIKYDAECNEVFSDDQPCKCAVTTQSFGNIYPDYVDSLSETLDDDSTLEFLNPSPYTALH
jgi:hypothetical protein